MPFGRPAPWRGSRQLERFGPFRDMERMMEEFFRGEIPSFGRSFLPRWGVFPSMDMYEEKDRYIVKAEIPGVEKEDVHVSVNDNVLLIRGEIKKEDSAREQDYFYRERYAGSFSRSIPLPSAVNPDQIKATFKNGVLNLEIPKAKETLEKEIKIEVK